jgi:protein-disulfide isomerase
MRLRIAWLAFSVAALVMLSACGDDDDAQGGGATSQSTARPSATSTTRTPVIDPTRLQSLADAAALGATTTKLTLAVFEDFQCPFCLRFTQNTEPVILAEYVLTGKVRFEFHNFPILGTESVSAAVAGTCAARQNRFWPYHDLLFKVEADAGQATSEKANVGRFSDARLASFAKDLGLDAAKFEACFASPEARQSVANDLQQAQAAGLRGTPSFFLNGKPIVSPPATIPDWRKLLDDALAGR